MLVRWDWVRLESVSYTVEAVFLVYEKGYKDLKKSGNTVKEACIFF